MHIIPDLKRLESKYGDGLVVIGVHSAKFTTEGTDEGIRDAVLRFGLEHPVVNDREMILWKRYGVRAWPSLVLIDPEGTARWKQAGEVTFEALDSLIGTLVDHFEKSKKLNKTPRPKALERDKLKSTDLLFPAKICAASGRLVVADTNNHRLLLLTPEGKIERQIGSGKEGRTDGTFELACFRRPHGVASSNHKIYVADTENHLLREADLVSGAVKTLAGTGRMGYPETGGPARQTDLNSPWDVAIDGTHIFVAMAGRHQVWRYDAERDEIRPFAGSGHERIEDGGLRDSAMSQPSGLSWDPAAKILYFADAEDSAVRLVDITHRTVRTIVGTGLFDFGDQDGKGKDVLLQHPLAVLYEGERLYVADAYNHKIKVCDPKTREVRTLAGDGQAGRTDGPTPRFSEPTGLAWLQGKLYVADTNNHAIRILDPASGAAQTLSLSR